MKKILPFLFLIALIAVVFLFSACSKEEKPREAVQSGPPVAITAAVVKAAEVPDNIVSVGTVESKKEAAVSAKVMGVIQQVWVEEGDRVGKGQVLLTIDDADIKAKRREAVQAKAEGVAALAEVNAAMDEAKAALANTNVNLGRMKNLYADNAVTKKELDDITTQYSMALAKVGQVAAKKKEVQAKIAQANAGISQTDIMLGYTVIRSPISGVVTQKMASAGEMATPGRPLVKVVNSHDLRLVATVNESEVSDLTRGQQLRVAVDALPGTDITGRISDIIPAADPATRSFTVKIDLPQLSGLMPGMFGKAYLPVGTRKAVLIPDGAHVDLEGVKGVFVVTPKGTLRFQAVKTGEKSEGLTEAVTGLSGGETVATGNLAGLTEGMKVTVKH